jgi:transposase-like protein
MEEITAYVTECCGAAMPEDRVHCPLCGAENPLIVKQEPTFACERCGYRGT